MLSLSPSSRPISPMPLDSFSEPYTRLGDDISLDQVRAQVHVLETEHKANGVHLSGRVIHVCHQLPVQPTLGTRPGVPSPPATPPLKSQEVGAVDAIKEVADAVVGTVADAASAVHQAVAGSIWTLASRDGHSAMISGIRSLATTHEQIIVGWTGDIQSPTPGEKISEHTIK